MTVQQWVTGRYHAGLTQIRATALGISQPYLAVGKRVADGATSVGAEGRCALWAFTNGIAVTRTGKGRRRRQPDGLQQQLAALGYPWFAHIGSDDRQNPAWVVFAAVIQRDLDTRARRSLALDHEHVYGFELAVVARSREAAECPKSTRPHRASRQGSETRPRKVVMRCRYSLRGNEILKKHAWPEKARYAVIRCRNGSALG